MSQRAVFRVLRNSASVFYPEADCLLEELPQQYDDTMAGNAYVPFLASQWGAKHRIATGQGGSNITTTSAAGLNGSTVWNVAHPSRSHQHDQEPWPAPRQTRHLRDVMAPGLIKTAMEALVPQL